MRFEPSLIGGVALIRLEPQHDERGSFARTFCERTFREAGFPFGVVQANLSRSTARSTLRGMHLQRSPYGEPKIISCTRGRIWDVAIDMRETSPTYRQWQAFELAPDANAAVFLPEGIAHGFLTLEPDSEVHYLMGAEFVPGAATGVRWDDPTIGVQWPAEPQIISARDRSYPLIEGKR
ncbi:MAG TPA: dTDP-4-dehydrorhamnose 3,5-epimerase family protein [Allosphingosinicella sp.]|nr:dTDP-4-dehydrorhamnose 3,5-epimerase family protein [Allosphingosinicella sp.]